MPPSVAGIVVVVRARVGPMVAVVGGTGATASRTGIGLWFGFWFFLGAIDRLPWFFLFGSDIWSFFDSDSVLTFVGMVVVIGIMFTWF